jgi:peptidyl-prolyl cis-trans isomerase C
MSLYKLLFASLAVVICESGCEDSGKKQQTKTEAEKAADAAGSVAASSATTPGSTGIAPAEQNAPASVQEGPRPAAPVENAKVEQTDTESAQDESSVIAAKFSGGQPIMKSEVMKRIEMLPERVRSVPFSQLYGLVLFAMVQERLAYASAIKSGFDKSEKVLADTETLQDRMLQQYYLEEQSRPMVTEEAIQEQYAKLVKSFVVEKEYGLSHILVDAREDALKILEDLARGMPFADLQNKHSKDRNGLGKPASLGFFRSSQLPPEQRAQIEATPTGSYVKVPVFIPNLGFSILYVDSIRNSSPAPLDKVKSRVRGILMTRLALQHVSELNQKYGVVLYSPDGTVLPVRSVDERLDELKAKKDRANDAPTEEDRRNDELLRKLNNDSVLAKIGDKVTVVFSDITAFVKENANMFRTPGAREYDMLLAALEEYVSRIVVKWAVAETKLAERPQIKTKVSEAKRSLIAQGLLTDLADKAVTEDDLRTKYDQYVSRIDRSKQEIRIRVIPVSSQSDGMTAINELKSGKDFDIVMEKYCSDQRFRDRKGDMGYLNENQLTMLSSDLCKAVVAAPTATILLKPIEVNGQLLVVRVEDKRQQEIPPYQQLKPQLRQRLIQEKMIKLTQDMYKEANGIAYGLDGNLIDLADERWVEMMGQSAQAPAAPYA